MWRRGDWLRLSAPRPGTGVSAPLPAALALVAQHFDDAVKVHILVQLPGIPLHGALADRTDAGDNPGLGKLVGKVRPRGDGGFEIDVGHAEGVQVGDVYTLLSRSGETSGRLRVTDVHELHAGAEVLERPASNDAGLVAVYLQSAREAADFKVNILVLNFLALAAPADAQAALGEQYARSLGEALRKKARGSPGVTILHGITESLPSGASEARLHEIARNLGERLRVDLVLWGAVRCLGDGPCVDVRYTAIHLGGGGAPVSPEKESFSLSFQAPVAAAPEPVAAAVLGLAAVQRAQPAAAQLYLRQALDAGTLRGEDQLTARWAVSRALWERGQTIASLQQMRAVVDQARQTGATRWETAGRDALRTLAPAVMPPLAAPPVTALQPAPPVTAPEPSSAVALGHVVAVVKDADSGVGVEGALVTVTLPDGQERTARSDAAGIFGFKDLPPGQVILRVDASGFLTGGTPVDIRPGETTLPAIRVQKRPKVSLVNLTDKELKLTLQIHFEVNSAKIRDESLPLLEAVVDTILRTPSIEKIEIQGHTDNSGFRDVNLTMSQQRADAVRSFLVSRGIAASKLIARGYGQEKPVAPNISDANRALNRRVQFIILESRASDP